MNLHDKKIFDWLPTTVKEMKMREWDDVDVVLFSGDAYIDHPSFGSAVISRLIESLGLNVAVVPQPNWRDDLRDFKKFGRPKKFFAVTGGNMDSMINHYTVNKRLRSNDAYTPGGKAGYRPDYATVVYSNILKKLYPDVPIIIGGIEASLRRVTHYDFWSDKLKPSILIDSKADLLVYGMAEKPLIDIVNLLKKGVPVSNLKNIPQTVFLINENEILPKLKGHSDIQLASHKECLKDKKKFAANFKIIETESNRVQADRILQQINTDTGKKMLVINPPYSNISTKDIDEIYDLPFTRLPHPRYKNKGNIPAFDMIKFSVNIHRGCFGGCSFCTISAHQGNKILSRSEKSILEEVDKIAKMPDFKGVLSDIGGPSANMYRMKGRDKSVCDQCRKPSCIFPKICPVLDTNHQPLTDLYKKIRNHLSIKKAFIGSGVRYDMIFEKARYERNRTILTKDKAEYLNELVVHHVSGRLKVAPEHTSDKVLKTMRKPSFAFFYRLLREFTAINNKHGMNQELIPYFISSHPDCNKEDMAELAIETKKLNFRLEQIQDFTPTPMTLATVIYYSGYDPYTLKKVATARTQKEKNIQRLFFFWYKKEYRRQIISELKNIGRNDLIGKLFGSKY